MIQPLDHLASMLFQVDSGTATMALIRILANMDPSGPLLKAHAQLQAHVAMLGLDYCTMKIQHYANKLLTYIMDVQSDVLKIN
jgi:hypothetical protein